MKKLLLFLCTKQWDTRNTQGEVEYICGIKTSWGKTKKNCVKSFHKGIIITATRIIIKKHLYKVVILQKRKCWKMEENKTIYNQYKLH